VICISLLLAPALALGSEEPVTKARTQTAPAGVRVYTNADLERYGRPREERPPLRSAPAPAPAVLTGPEIPAAPLDLVPAPVTQPEPPPAAAEEVPPEDRIEPVATEDLRAREEELRTLLEYLRAKEQWLKNPLLPAPTPPAGESLTNLDEGSGQQYQATRTRAGQAETRLLRVRALLKARGED